MINSDQIRIEFQRNETDCLICCLSMVTNIPYENIPDFCGKYGKSWPTELEKWLLTKGLGLVLLGQAKHLYVTPWLPVIVLGKTVYSDTLHFCIATPNGYIDPHPSDRGLTEVVKRLLIVQNPNQHLLLNNRPDFVHIMEHALGYGKGENCGGGIKFYRNHFMCGTETEDGKACQELVDLGYMVSLGVKEDCGGMTLFQVTNDGINALQKIKYERISM